MQLNLFQIIFDILIIYAIINTLIKAKDKSITIKETIFWLLMWTIGIITITLPSVSVRISSLLGIQRGVDVVIYSSIVILFVTIYKIYIKIDEIEQQIKKLNTKIAIKNSSKS